MGISVTELYEAAKGKYRLELRCGGGGLNNSATWVYLAEDIQNISFLKGGELIVTTGLFTRDGAEMIDFIRAVTLCNCSGIILNVGQYLHVQDITPEIVSFCDINCIPLFIMPWKIHLTDIMQDFCRMFFQDRQTENDLSATFLNALYQTQVPESILRTLNQYGFPTPEPYTVMVIRNVKDVTSITSPLNGHGLKYHFFQHDKRYILIFCNGQSKFSINDVINLVCYCDSVTVGVSDTVPNLNNLAVGYRKACFALAAAEFWKQPFARFDEMGLFQFLFEVPDTNLLHQHWKKYLGNLEEYDREHNTEYLETLHMFLLADCNLLDTAARLHTHRNTVVYRIKRIHEILGSPLDTAMIKFNLMLAFYIRDYFSI